MVTAAVKPHSNKHPNVSRVAKPNATSSNMELALKLLNNVAHIPGDSREDYVQQDRRTLWTQTRDLLKKQCYQVVGAGMQSADIQAARQIFDRDDSDLWTNRRQSFRRSPCVLVVQSILCPRAHSSGIFRVPHAQHADATAYGVADAALVTQARLTG